MQIRILNSLLLSSGLLMGHSSVQATILFSTSFDGWQSDMRSTFSRNLDHKVFETNHTNIASTLPTALPALDSSDPEYESKRMDWNNPANNVDLGRTATFERSDTQFEWSFSVSAVEDDKVTSSSSHYHGTEHEIGDTVESHIIYNDRINRNNFDQVNAFTDVLSIGKFKGYDTDEVASGDPYDWDNDDFLIEVLDGPALYAFAFELVNNKKYVDTTFNGGSSDGGLYSYGRESIRVTDETGQEFTFKDSTGELPLIPGYFNNPDTPNLDEGKYSDNFSDVQFIGIVSDSPFLLLEFNEDSRSDDIGIKNFMFAGEASPVPLPGALWMLSSGFVVLLRIIRKK